jgi:hypothetical protein
MEYFPQDAVVLADWSPAVVLEYLQGWKGSDRIFKYTTARAIRLHDI